jgi:hypothetical protein
VASGDPPADDPTDFSAVGWEELPHADNAIAATAAVATAGTKSTARREERFCSVMFTNLIQSE